MYIYVLILWSYIITVGIVSIRALKIFNVQAILAILTYELAFIPLFGRVLEWW